MNAILIDMPAVRCALGSDYAAIWSALKSGERVAVREDGVADDPGMRELGIDRKVARTTDKQARLLLAAAIECASDLDERARAECGMFLGLPTVDEPMPQIAAISDWHEERGRTPLAEHFKRHSAPLGWLAMLNSSAAAHVSTRLGITGPNGIYSPFADAGLNALIDAGLAIADGECSRALVGAVAPKHDPMLDVQYAHWCDESCMLPPGEASACVLLSRDDSADGVRLRGFARGFVAMPWGENAAEQVESLLAHALRMAGLDARQIGLTLFASAWRDRQADALRRVIAPFAQHGSALAVETLFGRLGAAAPLLSVGLALQAFAHGRALRAADRGELEERPLEASNALILAVSPHGQCAVAIVGAQP